ncbi:MAG: TonB-dependent receptor plug domain-containing protein, partial [Chloroflexota bacterium]
AAYLTTLPSVVASGDRGGQLFIRGGEPQQNLTMLDGMVLYQPFHVLGFYSAFPADVLDRVDFSAGGWGAKYSGRLSSVLDARSRIGNNRRFEGMASASPFSNAARLEGPIVPGRVSFLVTGRTSLIDQAGEAIYDQDLPFRFNDVFGKLHAAVGPRHRFSATGMQTYDRGGLSVGTEPRDIRWINEAMSIRWQAISKNLPLATELTYSRSAHRMEQDLPGDSTRLSSSVSSSRLSLHGVFSEGSMLGGRSVVEAGWDIEFGRTRNGQQALFLNQTSSGAPFPGFGFFVEPEMAYRNGLRVTPGLRMHIYNVRLVPYLEPRLRASWEGGGHTISAAAGIYYQQLLGLTDRRDPASVFTAWTAIPRAQSDVRSRVRDGLLRGRIGKSTHFILGYQRALMGGLDVSIEGFYKRCGNLFVARWEAFPVATTALQQATGQSVGLDLRGEFQRGPLYGSVSYGLSSTRYVADGPAIAFLFDQDRLHYRPPHDRRHNLNAVVSLDVWGFVAGLRWQFGSGFPYTKPLAFDGFALVNDVLPAFELFNANRVVYERPLGSILPTYHRLDLSLEREWTGSWGAVALQVSAINVYDRRNIFYLDVFTLERKDQLPFLPSLGLQVTFE